MEINFKYNGEEINCHCDNIKQKVGEIFLKYKTDVDLKSIIFLYSGTPINPNLSIGKIINNFDIKRKKIAIIVTGLKGESNLSLINSDNIICPKCGERAKFDIINYQIVLECTKGCPNDPLSLQDYENTQKMDISKIICQKCKTNNKADSYNNIFYRCIQCKMNLCIQCQNKHKSENNDHTFINYDDKEYICDKHNEKYISYCKKCEKNICLYCKNGHKMHPIINFEDLLPGINEANSNINKLKNNIDKFKEKINDLINMLNQRKNDIKFFFEIYKNILHSLNNKKINYEMLYSFNNIKKSEIMQDISYCKFNDNSGIMLQKLNEIFNKISNKFDDKKISYHTEEPKIIREERNIDKHKIESIMNRYEKNFNENIIENNIIRNENYINNRNSYENYLNNKYGYEDYYRNRYGYENHLDYNNNYGNYYKNRYSYENIMNNNNNKQKSNVNKNEKNIKNRLSHEKIINNNIEPLFIRNERHFELNLRDPNIKRNEKFNNNNDNDKIPHYINRNEKIINHNYKIESNFNRNEKITNYNKIEVNINDNKKIFNSNIIEPYNNRNDYIINNNFLEPNNIRNENIINNNINMNKGFLFDKYYNGPKINNNERIINNNNKIEPNININEKITNNNFIEPNIDKNEKANNNKIEPNINRNEKISNNIKIKPNMDNNEKASNNKIEPNININEKISNKNDEKLKIKKNK